MGKFIVKPIRGRDFYVIWHTGTESPTYYGSRADLETFLFEEQPLSVRRGCPELRLATRATIATEMNRVDAMGASTGAIRSGWSKTDFLLVEDGLPRCPGRPHYLKREDMEAFCLASGDEAHALVCEKARRG